MNLLRILATLGVTFILARAGPETFYLGTYTDHSGSHGIYRCTLDPETGRLGPIVLAATAKNPSFLALGPGEWTLYAVQETAPGYVLAFRRRKDDSLRWLDTRSSGGSGTCHVAVDPSGQWLLAADYASGTVTSFHLWTDGAMGSRAGGIQFTGSGPNRQRQEASHAHQATLIGNRVYVCDLGADEIWNLTLDPSSGAISYLHPPGISLPPGSGPRHLVVIGDHLYVASELAGTITVFEVHDAVAKLQQTLPALPPSVLPSTRTAPAEIAPGHDNETLYISDRGNDMISVFKIASDGSLKFDESVPCGVKGPRSFAIDPSGRWMVVAGQYDNRIAVLAIDRDSGRLGSPKSSAQVGSPVCIVFLQRHR